MGRYVLLGAFPNTFMTFRGDLVRFLQSQGHQVDVMTAEASPEVRAQIESLGVELVPYPIWRNGLRVRDDMQTLWALGRIFRARQPDAVLAYTVKPIIWGGIAARLIPRCRFVAMVTGLGYAFQGKTIKRRLLNKLVKQLYRLALRRANAVIFQNAENRDVFIKLRLVSPAKCHVVSGSGINLQRFHAAPLPGGPPTFLLIARLLGEKGIREYVAAAEIIKQSHPNARFHLVGFPDPSPDGLSMEQIHAWHDSGAIAFLGEAPDVRPFLHDCHIYCLPSYHEGMPRTVLEAMATGRPILTTDVTGCRETVVAGENGWLVPHANVEALVERMLWFIENREQWQPMADASRRMAEERFDVEIVNRDILRVLEGG